MNEVVFFLIVGTAVWVWFDAKSLGVRKGRLGGGSIDMGPVSWVICCLVLWLLAFPCYLVARSKYLALRNSPPAQLVGIPAPTEWSPPPAAAQLPAAVPVAVVPVQTLPAAPVAVPPQLSPDGHWWWDGSQWIPAADRVLSQG